MPSQTSPNIFKVWPENVNALWPQIAPLLTPALAVSSTHEPEDVRKAVMSGKAQLWVQMGEHNLVEATVTTEFVDYPSGVFVRVWSAGAHPEHRMNTEGFLPILTEFGHRNGCIGFEAIGRHGWLRKIPQARVEGLIMRMLF
jgi:hypothetical protein